MKLIITGGAGFIGSNFIYKYHLEYEFIDKKKKNYFFEFYKLDEYISKFA